MKTSPDTDESLLAAYRGGDEAAFQALFERYEERLLAYLVTLCGNLELARDLTQEAFLRLATRPPRMLFGGRVQAWLFRVGRNLAMDQFRKPMILSAERESPLSPHEELARQDDNAQLHRLLDALPEDLRHIVCQRLFAGRSFREISAADAIPMGTAMWRMHRALGLLRRQLRDEVGQR
ncbi:MAG: RNA polymerase sigma-70 factor (ECF subfamily) [Rhodothermales bacterium]|jgi:RNA polymerase sigma-70 factor (ECF subfamily)